MTSLAFPIDPNVGQTYVAPGGKVWRWGGEGWICLVDSGSQIYYNSTPPEDIAKYPLWMNTDTGDLMVFYQDVDSDQWIKIGTTGGGGGAGGTGGGATYITDLNDVDTTGVGVGNVLEWDGTNWSPTVPAGAGSIDTMTDVDTTTDAPALNDFLVWNNTNWVPFTLVTTDWDTAYSHSQSAHAPSDADNTATNETSHADVVQDGDFIANGIMVRTSAGAYSNITDGSTNWDTAYSHSQASHAPADADNTAANETSHANVLTTAHETGHAEPLAVEDEATPLTANAKKINFAGAGVVATEPVADEILVTIDGGGGGSALEVEDEGISLSTGVTKINFAGTGVTATEPVADEILVTIAGGAGVSELDDLSDVDTTTTAPTTDDVLAYDGTNFVPVANAGGSGGASAFKGLTDTPPDYTNQKGKIPVVNQDETGLEFGTQGNIVYSDEVSFRSQVDAVGTTLNASATTTIVHDQVAWNHGGGTYDDTTGYYYVPVAGRYRVNARMFLGSGVASNTYYIQVSGSVGGGAGRFSEYQSGTTFVPVAGSCVIDCVEGEYIKVNGYNGSGTNEALYSGGSSDEYNYIEIDLLTPNITVAPYGIQHGFKVTKESEGVNQTITANVKTEVTWSDSDHATNASFDFVNNQFVVPSSGLWHFDVAINPQGTSALGNTMLVYLHVDGVEHNIGEINRSTGSSPVGAGIHADVDLLAGQTVSVQAFITLASTTINYLPLSTYFSGHKVNASSTGVEYDSHDVAFRSYLSVDSSVITAATWTPVVFDSIHFDTGKNFDTSTGHFIAPVSGVYHINGGANFQGVVAGERIYLQASQVGSVGTSARLGFDFDSFTTSYITGGATFQMEAGDYIEIRVYVEGATTFLDAGSSSDTWVSGHLVQATTKAESSFGVHRNSVNQTITANTATKVLYTTEEYNNGGNFDTALSRYTAPEDGRYLFDFGVGVLNQDAGDTFYINLYLNGVSHRVFGYDTTDKQFTVGKNGSTTLSLSKDDYVEIFATAEMSFNTVDEINGSSGYTYFNGYRLMSSQDVSKNTTDLLDVNDKAPVAGQVLLHDGDQYVPNDVVTSEYSFRSRGVDTSMLSKVDTKVDFIAPYFNIGGGMSDTGTYTVPKSGRYDFSATLRVDALGAAKYINAKIYKNGVEEVKGTINSDPSSATSWQESTVNGVVDCVAGDEIEIWGYMSDDVARNCVGTWTTFSGHMIAPDVTIAPTAIDHSFFVVGTDAQSFPATTNITLDWDYAEYLKNCSFDFVNDKFIAPSSGTYHFDCVITATSIGDNARLYSSFYVIGATGTKIIHFEDFNQSGTDLGRYGGSMDFYLEAGDTVHVNTYNNSATTTIRQSSSIETWFSGHKVGGSPTGIEYDSHNIGFRSSLIANEVVATPTSRSKIPFDTVSNANHGYDAGGNFDTTNNYFVCPVSGIYAFYVSVNPTALDDQSRLIVYVYRNVGDADESNMGFNETSVSAATTSNTACSVAISGYCDAGDKIEANFIVLNHVGSTTIQSTASGTQFGGYLVNSQTKAECSFRAYLSADDTGFVADADNVVELNGLSYDYGNNFDTTTHKFTAPEDGRYQFNGQVRSSTMLVTETCIPSLYVNGSVVTYGGYNPSEGTGQQSNSVNDILDLTKGDYVELRAHHTGATPETIQGSADGSRTYFSGYRLISSVDAPRSLEDLSGVSSTMPVTNDVLMYNGTEYVPTDVLTENVEHSFRSSIADTSIAASSVQTKIDLSSAIFDIGSNLDFTNDRFVVPVDGRYQFNATARLSDLGTGKYFQLVLYKNGAIRVWGSYNGGDTASEQTFVESQVQVVDTAVAGDYFELYALNTDSSPRSITGSRSTFSGHLVSPNNNITLAPHGIDLGFSVNLGNSDQVISETAPHTVEVEWTEARYEKNCHYDFANNRFVAPSAGIYQFGATLQLLNVAGTNFTLEIITSKGTFTGHRINVDNYTSFLGHANIYLDAGDTAYVTIYSSSDSSYSIRGFQNWSYFFGTKISGSNTGIEYDSYDIAFRAYQNNLVNGTQDILHHIVTDIRYDSIDYDKGSNFDLVNNVFIVPVDGMYQFTGSATWSVMTPIADEEFTIYYVIDDVVYILERHFQDTASGAFVHRQTFNRYLSAGQKIGMAVRQGTGSTQTLNASDTWATEFTGYLVQATTKAECSFNANRNGTDQTTTVSGWTKILLTNTEFNYGNSFDSVTNNRFVAPEDGRYVFNWSSGIEGLGTSSTRFASALKLNDAVYYQGSRAAINTTEVVHISSGSVILDLVKGDYAELWITQDESTTEVIRGESYQTYLSGYRLVTSQDLSVPTEINSLDDVVSINPEIGSTLTYNGFKWVAGDIHLTKSVVYNNQTNTTYTIQESDVGKIITFNNASAIAVTLPDTLPVDFQCTIIQVGVGVPTVTRSGTDTINGVATGVATVGQWKGLHLSQYTEGSWISLQ